MKTSPVSLSELNTSITKSHSQSQAITDQPVDVDGLSAVDTIKTSEQAEKRMMMYWAAFEQNNQAFKQIQALAAQVSDRFKTHSMIQKINRRLNQYSEWTSIESIVNSAGLRFIKAIGWQPGAQSLQIQKAMMPPGVAHNEHVIFADQQLLVMVTNFKPKALNIQVCMNDIASLPSQPVYLNYHVNDGQTERVKLDKPEQWKPLTLELPVGVNQIRFDLEESVAKQIVKIRINDEAHNVQMRREKAYFVAKQNEPLQFYVEGPTVIRIDEWKHNTVESSQKIVSDKGWQLISLLPPTEQNESLFQIKQRKIKQTQPKSIHHRTVERTIQTVPVPELQSSAKYIKKPDAMDDFYHLEGQDKGTWTIDTQWVRRNNVQEDFIQGDPEHFQQFNLIHRYFDDDQNRFWHSQAYVRYREHGNPSFGLKESVLLRPNDWPFNFQFSANLNAQEIADQVEWSGQMQMAVSQTAHVFKKTLITPKLSWFGRYLSMRDSERVIKDGTLKDSQLIEKVDQNLYTAYKAQHTTGMAASLLFTHDPWLDTRWQAKFKSVSNEDMNLFNPDYFQAEVHWRQLLADVTQL